MDIAVSVKDVSKKYSLYKDPWGPIKEIITKKKLHKEFFALNNVSLDFPKGESIGVLGKNGSGKSTLLKIITGITEPTNGDLKVNGSIVFLDVSSGIDSELSGYENIFMKGTLLGYSKEEMMQKVDDIINFSELGEFIEQPVKNYSSGMKSKLGFAISVNVDPDILIVDEALAVGDSVFRKKCMDKMNEFKKEGKTIIFVSHDKDAVESFCSKAAWLHQGELITYGDSKFVGSLYDDFMSGRKQLNSIRAELQYQHSIEKVIYGGNTVDGFSVQLEGFLRNEKDEAIHDQFDLVVKDLRTGESILKPLVSTNAGFSVVIKEREFPMFFKPGNFSFNIQSNSFAENLVGFSPWSGRVELQEETADISQQFKYKFNNDKNKLILTIQNLDKLEEQVNKIWFEGNSLNIQGVAFIRGYETKSQDAIEMSFYLTNLDNFERFKLPVSISETDEITENPVYNPQGKVYNFSEFKVLINLKDLKTGRYESHLTYKMNNAPSYELINLVWASKHSEYPNEPYIIEDSQIEIKTETRYLQIEKINYIKIQELH